MRFDKVRSVWTVSGLGLAAALCLSVPAGGQGGGNITTTNSTTSGNTITVVAGNNTINRGYSTQVLGVLSHAVAGTNTTVFNVTVDSALDLQAAAQQFSLARQAVQAAHNQSGNSQLELSAARLVSSQPVAAATNSTQVDTVTGTNTTVSTQSTFGPTTILIGPEQSVTFFVAAGTININTNVHTQTLINRRTDVTQTSTKAAVYQITGVSRP